MSTADLNATLQISYQYCVTFHFPSKYHVQYYNLMDLHVDIIYLNCHYLFYFMTKSTKYCSPNLVDHATRIITWAPSGLIADAIG